MNRASCIVVMIAVDDKLAIEADESLTREFYRHCSQDGSSRHGECPCASLFDVIQSIRASRTPEITKVM
jgi:hypothetical protein